MVVYVNRVEKDIGLDLMLPKELWLEISMEDENEMLCGSCIMKRVEGIGKFGVYELRVKDE